ncbi:MAG: HAMP domain-containing histidine kinase [Elusimicrobia bacterium]|nr:HAMP domain-containing histidine kinase [Elusimicrobiota bacterium]
MESKSSSSSSTADRLQALIVCVRQLRQGRFAIDVPPPSGDELDPLGSALEKLARTLEVRQLEEQKLEQIMLRINAGLLFDEVLEYIYQNFHEMIPYNRIGFSLIENGGQMVTARWMKSDLPTIRLGPGFSAPLAGSSLQSVFDTGKPRILNNLPDYLREHPRSESTRLIVEEGIRSSLTCPLIVRGAPVGFLFFSSVHPGAYDDAHIHLFQRIAEEVSVIVEKGRLVSDLADQKAAIERQNEELRRLGEMKNAFLGVAAHDLRSPITYIQMAVSHLLNHQIPEVDRQSFMRDIQIQTRYMSALLNDLLDISHIESGKFSVNFDSIPLADFLEDAVQRHAKMAEPKGICVVLESPPQGSVSADPLRLRQVIDNLISNAVKFSPAGTLVQVHAGFTGTGWRVAVQDNGPGISLKDQEVLFQDFAHLSARPSSPEKSTGLGLAITRRIIEAHGGRIAVNSSPGKGSTFWFTIPNR